MPRNKSHLRGDIGLCSFFLLLATRCAWQSSGRASKFIGRLFAIVSFRGQLAAAAVAKLYGEDAGGAVQRIEHPVVLRIPGDRHFPGRRRPGNFNSGGSAILMQCSRRRGLRGLTDEIDFQFEIRAVRAASAHDPRDFCKCIAAARNHKCRSGKAQNKTSTVHLSSPTDCVAAIHLHGTLEQAPELAGQDWQYVRPLLSTQVPQLVPLGCLDQTQLSATAPELMSESAAAMMTTNDFRYSTISLPGRDSRTATDLTQTFAPCPASCKPTDAERRAHAGRERASIAAFGLLRAWRPLQRSNLKPALSGSKCPMQ